MRTVHLAEGLLVADNLFLLHPPPTHPRTEPSRPDLGWRARAVPPNMDFYCASHFHEVLTTRRYRLSINRGPSGFVRHASADRETSDVSELDFSDSFGQFQKRLVLVGASTRRTEDAAVGAATRKNRMLKLKRRRCGKSSSLTSPKVSDIDSYRE